MTETYICLDPDDIRMLHDEQIELYGGIYGESEPNLIDYTTDKPSLTLFGQEQYPTLSLKAAVYLDSFIKNQYFSDGNKRTGVKCSLVFLAINGYQLTVTDHELFTFALGVAESSDPTNEREEIKLEEIAKWIEKNTVKNLDFF